MNSPYRVRRRWSCRPQAGDPDTQVVNKGNTTRDIIAAPEGDGQDARAAVPQ